MKHSNLVRAFALANALWALAALGQGVPQQLSFTGNLTGSGGPATGTHNFVFRLFDSASGGTVAWAETQNNLVVNNGLVITTLGATTPFTPAILNGAPLFLEVSVDGSALSPRVPVLSVPYAIRAGIANTAASLGALAPSDVQRRVTGVCSGGNAIQTIDATGTVVCVPVGTGDITGVTTAGGSGLTGGTASGDANLTVDTSVQRRGVAPNDLTCPVGQYVRSISATGAAICAVENDTGVNAVTPGSGISASIAGRTLTLGNTGVLSLTSGNAFLTAAVAAGAANITANVGTTPNTLAAGNHGHNLGCGYRAVSAAAGSTTVSVTCNAGEVLTGGGCNSDGTIEDSNPFQSCPPSIFCVCFAGSRCSADSWRCTRASGTSVTAYAMCCDSPVRGNVP